MAVLLPLAHAGHWLWVLYIPPVLVVIGSMAYSTISERRRSGQAPRSKRGPD